MRLHRNAKLGLAGRFALVTAIERGCSIREAARRHGVCRRPPAPGGTAGATRASRSGHTRLPARPPKSASILPADPARRRSGADLRGAAQDGWGPRLLAGALGHPHATVSKTLARHGCSRRQRPAREPANCYEWPCPGELLHMDSTSYARFERPRPRRHRRPCQDRRRQTRSRRLRLRARDRRRPFPAGLRRAPARREGGDGGRLHGARCASSRRKGSRPSG
jgi:hypothetical protein